MSYYKKVTLKDIANDSGVSVSSVSMILNKREGVSDCRQTRCWDHPSTIFSFKVKLYPKIS